MLSLIFFFLCPFIVNASRPPSSPKFTYVNKGSFGASSAEYGATYRPLPISNPPFQLCFYNTTPNSYTLALGMFAARSHPSIRWVWEANRGKPVQENAKLVFQPNGNLILVDSDGRVAWQTKTSNRNVAGIKVSRNGNLILHGKQGNITWQSFDYPTDTLLVGQSLVQETGPTKLVSRASDKVNRDGRYSFVLEPERLAFYYQGQNSPTPLIYDILFEPDFSQVGFMRLESVKRSRKKANGYDIILRFGAHVSEDGPDFYTWASMKYDSRLSFIRLGTDGNFRVFTYNNETTSWNQSFALFSDNPDWESGCRLPEKCGNFGLCDKNQCVACPSPSGLLNWSKDCRPTKLTSCKAEDIGYYKLEGVSQYSAWDANNFIEFVEEPVCRKNCTADCKCLGYFYNEYRRQCWIAYDLMTLMKTSDAPGRLAYIKYSLK